MSGLVVLLAGGMSATGVITLGLWGMWEGFRQGDKPGDTSVTVAILGSEEARTLRATITNPQAVPVVAAVKVTAIRGGLPVRAPLGRATLRRQPDLTHALVHAVDGHEVAQVDWTLPPSADTTLLVDVYVWQRLAGACRHRHRCHLTQTEPAAWRESSDSGGRPGR